MTRAFTKMIHNDTSDQADPNSSANVTTYDPVILFLADFIWWYVVVAAVVGTFLNAASLIYLLTKRRAGTVVTCMSCVVIADCVFLTSVLGGFLMACFVPDFPGLIICKFMTFNTNVTSLFSNWCWVILWGGHYLAVFHPWFYYRFKYYSKLSCMLPMLLVGCVLWESWTLILTTDVNTAELICDLDTNVATYFTFKYLLLLESCLSFFVPLMLVLIADVRVFFWQSPMELIGPADLCPNGDPVASAKRRPVNLEHLAVVSLKYKKSVVDGNRKIMKRFVLLASVDLLLNFPQLIVHLSVAFRRGATRDLNNGEETVGQDRLEYVISAVGYSLYYLQYLLNAVHIAMLIPAEEKQRQRRRHTFERQSSNATCSPSNFGALMMRNSFSRNSTSKNEGTEKPGQQKCANERYLSERRRADSSPLVQSKERVDSITHILTRPALVHETMVQIQSKNS